MFSKISIPSIDSLQEDARNIQADDDPSSIENKLRQFMQYYEVLNYEIKNTILWRARKAENSDGYSNTKDVYYPPANKSKIGRLNEENQPLLYASFNTFTTLTEINAKKDDYIHIIGYSLKDKQSINTLTLGEFFYAHQGSHTNISQGLSKSINNKLNKMNYERSLSIVFMDAFLTSLLTDETASSSNYLHTRKLAKVLFENNPQIDAIHYPSVMNNGSMNLAVKPNIADKALKIKGTSVLHIDNIFDYGLFRFSMVRNAKDYKQNEKIIWD